MNPKTFSLWRRLPEFFELKVLAFVAVTLGAMFAALGIAGLFSSFGQNEHDVELTGKSQRFKQERIGNWVSTLTDTKTGREFLVVQTPKGVAVVDLGAVTKPPDEK